MRNFIDDFLTYCEGSEVPDMFYVWSGYAALSTFIGRNVFLRSGRMIYYPNVYEVLVGSAGSGKTQAMDVAKRLIEDVPGMAPRISMSTETLQGWIRYIAGDPDANPPVASQVVSPVTWPTGSIGPSYPALIKANEFINFIANDPIGWITTLNDIYDQDFFGYRTKNMGQDQISGPCITLLGALPTETSQELQKAHIIASGFARRTIFQYGERKFHEPHAIIHHDQSKETLRASLIEYGTALTKVHGEFTWSEDTRAWWTEWYDNNSVSVPRAEPHLVDWLNSKPAQTIKIGMLTSLAESFDLELKISHLQRALDYFEILERDLYKIFGGIGRNELAAVCVQIMHFISGQTMPMTFEAIRKASFKFCKPPYEFGYCLDHLKATGELVESVWTFGFPPQVQTMIGTPEQIATFKATHCPPRDEASAARGS